MDFNSFSATAFLNVGSGFRPETLLAWMNDEKVAVAFALIFLAITYLTTQAAFGYAKGKAAPTQATLLPHNPHFTAHVANVRTGATASVDVYPSYPILEIPMLVTDFAPEPTADMPYAAGNPFQHISALEHQHDEGQNQEYPHPARIAVR